MDLFMGESTPRIKNYKFMQKIWTFVKKLGLIRVKSGRFLLTCWHKAWWSIECVQVIMHVAHRSNFQTGRQHDGFEPPNDCTISRTVFICFRTVLNIVKRRREAADNTTDMLL